MPEDTPQGPEDEPIDIPDESSEVRSRREDMDLHPATGHGPPMDWNPPEIPEVWDEPEALGTAPESPAWGLETPRPGDPSRRTPTTKPGWLVTVAIALTAALVGGAIGAAMVLAFDEDAPVTVERVETPVAAPGNLPITGAAAVAELVLPSIVTVEIDLDGGEFTTQGSGSGVILTEDGLIITNHHVVNDAALVRAVFPDGRTYDAEVVGSDALTDVAVIRIDASGLTPIPIGSSEAMEIGDVTVAVGSPLGLEGGPSVTVGVLSAIDRRVQTSTTELFGMLQTDAPITRGSSGGALVDSEGRLVGITSAIGVSDVGAEGLGFAIPVELVQRVVADLIETGTAAHAFLGITGSTHFETLSDGALAPSGVNVDSILPATAAAGAGLEEGDTIVTFDGEPVSTMNRLVVRIRFYRVGDTVEVGILRGDQELTVDVTLLERPEGV